MANKKYDELARAVLEHVGGADNVTFCTHCMTRLRFNLRDKSLVQEDELKATDGVAGITWASDQLQVIIGTAVNMVYEEVCAIGHFDKQDAINENLDADEPKRPRSIKGFFGGLMKTMAEIMIPVIGIYISMGMFAAIIAVFGPQGLGVMAADSGLYRLLDFAQLSINYFVPFYIAYSASQRFHTSPITSLGLVGIMMYPDLMSEITDGTLSIFGLVPAATPLNGQTIPVMLAVWLLSYVERLLNRYMPPSLQFSLNGTIALVILVPVSLYLLNPIGNAVSTLIAMPVSFVYEICPPAVCLLLGVIWIPLIMTGMHMVVAGMFYGTFFMTGTEFALFPIMRAIAFTPIFVNIAVILLTKDKNEKALAREGIISLTVGGVIEPSLYGIYLKYPRMLIAACAGLGASGLVMGILHVGVFAMPANGLFGVMSVMAGGMPNFIWFCVATAVGCVVSFAVAMVLGLGAKKEDAAAPQQA